MTQNRQKLSMDESELILSINQTTSTMLSEEAVFYSQLSAYLVVAYLVGAKLTRFQISLNNFVFVVATGLGIFSVMGLNGYINKLVELSGIDLNDN